MKGAPRRLREYSAAFDGKVGSRRFPFWYKDSMAFNGQLACHLKPGVGQIINVTKQVNGVPSPIPVWPFIKMIGGSEIASRGVANQTILPNRIETPADLAGHGWTATNVVVGAAEVEDMYGGTGAQKLTPSDVAAKVRSSNEHVSSANKCLQFCIDLRADVAHNAQISIDNNLGSETTLECAVTTVWKRFYATKTLAVGAGQIFCASIYPDIDLGTQAVYVRMPYLGDTLPANAVNSVFGNAVVDGYPSGNGYSHLACTRMPSLFSLRKGTIAMLFAPMFDIKFPGTTKHHLLDAGIFNEDYSVYNFVQLYFDGTNLTAWATDTDGNVLTVVETMDNLNMARGTYVFLSLSWKATDLSLYKNGVLVGSDQSQILSNIHYPLPTTATQWSLFGLNQYHPITACTSPCEGVVRNFMYRPEYLNVSDHLKLFNEWKRYGGIA